MEIINHTSPRPTHMHAGQLTTIAAVFLCFALAHSGLGKPSEAKLLMTNGDRLSGTPTFNVEQQELSLEAYYLSVPATLPLSNVLSIELENKNTQQAPDPYTRIQLHPRNQETAGDTLLGELKELTNESIIIDTRYGESITLKRSMVQSLDIVSQGRGQYHGPNSLEEWELPAEDKVKPWTLRSNQLVAEGQDRAIIGKDIGLHKKTHLSFDLSWDKYPNFSAILYSGNVTSLDPKACYKISFDNYSASMSTFINGRETRDNRQRFADRIRSSNARFELFIDSETGVALVYIDGKQACILQSTNPNPEGLGTGMSFVSQTTNRTSISNIKISPWSGIRADNPDATSKELPAGNAAGQQAQHPHNIILLNGDVVPGTVVIIENGRMLVETEHTPIHIPVSNIQSISLGDKREEPKKYKGDVRAWFCHGGFITLRMASIKDNKLHGYSQATGDVSIDMGALSRIDLNIYSLSLNEQREKYFSQQ